MIENLVDAWLTDASERSYETAFAQLLVIEGHTVIQGPMHHSHEHGKDIITLDPEQRLVVYQLKGGSGKLDTDAVEQAQDQLFVAATSVVNHPSLEDSELPEKVFLVTNQSATGPAQGRIKTLSDGWAGNGFASLHLIERDELKSRFVHAEGRFFPSSPRALNTFLTLFLSNGRGPIPESEFFDLLSQVLPVSGSRPKAAETQRAISAASLTIAFALKPWADLENHAELAMGWLYYCSQVLRVVQRIGLSGARWESSYRLGLEEARRRIALLVTEALDEPDLAVGHPADPLVYSARAVKISGLTAALLLSELIEFGECVQNRQMTRLLKRELDALRIVTEHQVPSYLLTVLALLRTGYIRSGTQWLFNLIASLARANSPESDQAIPDPYHTPQEVLLGRIGPEDGELEDEQFAGRSYTLHVAIRWAVRRLWRQSLAARWQEISRVENCAFYPKYPIEYLYHRSPNGVLRTWHYPRPTSWRALLDSVRDLDTERLPNVLLESPEYVPFFCIVFPHRFIPEISDLLDHLA